MRRQREDLEAEALPSSPPSLPRHPAYHEHKHAQKLCQALPGQEAADPEPALDAGQGLAIRHGGTPCLWLLPHSHSHCLPDSENDKRKTLKPISSASEQQCLYTCVGREARDNGSTSKGRLSDQRLEFARALPALSSPFLPGVAPSHADGLEEVPWVSAWPQQPAPTPLLMTWGASGLAKAIQLLRGKV